MKTTRLIISLLAVAGLATTAVGVGPTSEGIYEGPGIVVTKFGFGAGQIAVLDNGAVVCDATPTSSNMYNGKGGVCLPFDTLHQPTPTGVVNNAIEVRDAQHDAVFQVCVDNNQDNACTGGSDQGLTIFPPTACDFDTIIYSHESQSGDNNNPLHIPQWVENFWRTCNPGGASGNAWGGYVVMICAGVHDNQLGTNPHVHQASTGIVRGADVDPTTAEYGDFCGAPTATKEYVVTP